tara:strand:+ start:1344 stop:1571 length:228 start_codon:yes stop_codon:yes gene_type:complete
MKLTEEIVLGFGFTKRWIYKPNAIHPKGWFVYEIEDVMDLNDDFSYSPLNVSHEIKTVDQLKSLYFGLTGKQLSK